jgi:putative transposase
VKEVKIGSSKWVKKHKLGVPEFNWQSGYAAFSVSPSNAPRVKRYIGTHETHHRRTTFQDELREFLRKHEVEFDERYVWD